MALQDAAHLRGILTRPTRDGVPPCEVFVESGTFHGKTTRWAVPLFREVHTIELHPVWYAEAVVELTPLGVHCYHGDSAAILPQSPARY